MHVFIYLLLSLILFGQWTGLYTMNLTFPNYINLLYIYIFIIYYVMKYRKILIKYNAYISQPWKYKNLYIKIWYFHGRETL